MLNRNFHQNTMDWSNTYWTTKDNILEQASRVCSQHRHLYEYSVTKWKQIEYYCYLRVLLPFATICIIHQRRAVFWQWGKVYMKLNLQNVKGSTIGRVNDIPERYCIRSIDLSHCCQISFQLWVLMKFSIIANLPEKKKKSRISYLLHYWHLI